MFRVWPKVLLLCHGQLLALFLLTSSSGCIPATSATPGTSDQRRSDPKSENVRLEDRNSSSRIPSVEESMVAAQELLEPTIDEPSPHEPVTAAIQIRPQAASPGEKVELLIFARIAPAHYLHAEDPDETFVPVTVKDFMPDGVEAVGDWIFSDPVKKPDASPVYRNSILIRRVVKILPDVTAQTLTFSGKLRYQACNDELCWPPREMELTATLTLQKPTR